MKALLTVVAFILLFGSTKAASAYPYQLFAKYSVSSAAPDKSPKIDRVELVAHHPKPADSDEPQPAAFVPTNATNAQFLGIFISAKTDGVAQSELDRMDAIYVDVCAVGQACDHPLTHKRFAISSLKDGKDQLVLFPGDLAGHDVVTKVYLEVRLHFRGDYLCELETKLREVSGKPILVGPATPLTLREPSAGRGAPKTSGVTVNIDATNASVLNTHDGSIDLRSYGALFDHGLTDADGKAVIYSYCEGVYRDINWAVLAKLRPTDSDPHKTEKAALAKMILPSLNDPDAFGAVHQEIYSRAEPPEQSEHTYGQFRHYTSLVRHLPGVKFVETGYGALSRIVDKSSQIEMRVDSSFCEYLVNCNVIVGTKLSAEVRYTDSNSKETTATAPLKANGQGWVIASDLEKHIRDQLKIVVYYSLDEASRVVILESEDKATVENLGLITTFPAITEVTALSNGTAAEPNNSSARSTIPLSWALNLSRKTATSAAVTLPWLMGINTRGMPRLADYISIFPHVSAIVPFSDQDSGSSDGTDKPPARIALGAGVALAKAFTISVGWPIKGETQTYLLLGVSATDLADAFKAMK